MNGRPGRPDRPETLSLTLVEDLLNDRQRLLLDTAKMVAPLEALRVELVDVFGARGTRREPAARSDHFQPADGRVVPRRRREPRGDPLTRELGGRDLFRRQPGEPRLLFGGRRRVDALVGALAEFRRELAVELAGVAPCHRGHLRGKEAENDPVLVGGPHRAVAAEERGPRALLA